jgi:hypothetical protein
MDYDEKLDLILARLDEIEAKIATPLPPESLGGLFDFVRPSTEDDGYGLGSPMTGPDAAEAIKRACGNVNWRGDVALTEKERDARWVLVERLKKADPTILPFYVHLDPAFCGYGLLTGAFAPHTSDGPSFGATKRARESFAGVSLGDFLADQFAVGGSPGIG